MKTKEAILSRRSIRKFTDSEVSFELLEQIVEAGCSAPSACNKKPYEIYVVTNEEILEKLNKSSRFSNMPSKAKIVVCCNLKKALPLGLSDYWIQDASAVVENMLIMINELGLGACWCGLYPQVKPTEKVREILELDEKIVPMALINLGWPKEIREPHSGIDEKRVHFIK